MPVLVQAAQPLQRRLIGQSLNGGPSCRCCGFPWVEDPSNLDSSYQRVAIRQLLAAWSSTSVEADVLQVAGACRSLGDSLRSQAEQLLDSATISAAPGSKGDLPDGAVLLSVSDFLGGGYTRPVQVACLSLLLQRVSDSRYPPRSNGVEQLLRRLQEANDGAVRRCNFSVGGCSVSAVLGSREKLVAAVARSPRHTEQQQE